MGRLQTLNIGASGFRKSGLITVKYPRVLLEANKEQRLAQGRLEPAVLRLAAHIWVIEISNAALEKSFSSHIGLIC